MTDNFISVYINISRLKGQETQNELHHYTRV